MNLAEGYQERAPPDIVRSVMPISFSNRNLYSGTDGAETGSYEDNRTQPEKHRNGAGGTWPRQVQGHSYANYPDGPLDNSATFRPSTVLPSPRSRSSRFLSQSVESPLWSEGRTDPARDHAVDHAIDPARYHARDPFASSLPTITIQDFSAATLPGFSMHNTRHSPSRERQPASFVTTSGAGLQNNKDYAGHLRSPLMNDRRYYGAASLHGPFYATSSDHPHWNNARGSGGRSEIVHCISKGAVTSPETGTGDCYTRVTQQLMRDSENLSVDQLLHSATNQTRHSPETRSSNETSKGDSDFPLPGRSTSSAAEDNSRNLDNRMQHLWRNHINPLIGRVDLTGGFNWRPIDGYSSESCLTARSTDVTISREHCSDGAHMDTTAAERNVPPRSQHWHDSNFSHGRSVSYGDTLSNDRSFSQDRNFSHDAEHLFSHNLNLAHDRSFSDNGPCSDSRGTNAGRRTLLEDVAGAYQLEDSLHRWVNPLAPEERVKGQGNGSRLIKEMLDTRYNRSGNDRQEDLVSSSRLTETPEEGAKTVIECGKAMMGQHRKWIEMEERLLGRIYELQKERSHLTVKVEELTAENRDLSKKFKDTAEQLETKELEMENVRRQLREKIADMTSTANTSHTDSTPPASRRDAFVSHQQRYHDSDVDARRGRQVAQEELAACQIRFARERERWISEKIKVLRYQQLLQAKYEQVVAENQLFKEQVQKESCQSVTPIRSTMTQQRLTLLKDRPSGLSFDSVC